MYAIVGTVLFERFPSIFVFSCPFSPSQRDLQHKRDVGVSGVGGATRLWWPSRPCVQRGVQEVRARCLRALRRQCRGRAAAPGPRRETRGRQEPASSHALQLRDPGRQRRLAQEPRHAALRHRQYNHQSGG